MAGQLGNFVLLYVRRFFRPLALGQAINKEVIKESRFFYDNAIGEVGKESRYSGIQLEANGRSIMHQNILREYAVWYAPPSNSLMLELQCYHAWNTIDRSLGAKVIEDVIVILLK